MHGTHARFQPRAERRAARRLHSGVRRRFVSLALLKPNWIATTDRAAQPYGSIHTDVDLVMMGRRAQDSRIPREIPLRERGHHVTTSFASLGLRDPPARAWSSRNARKDQ
jgi:hypothetical protein